MAKVELNEFASRGIVLMIDGKPMQLPFQIIRWPDKHTSIRIGNNMLHFRLDGSFEGPEARIDPATPDFTDVAKQYKGMLESTDANRGLMPREPYYLPNSEGFHVERNADPGPRDRGGDVYGVIADASGAEQLVNPEDIHEMTLADKTKEIIDHLPASGLAHLCEKIFGKGEFPKGLLDDVNSVLEDMVQLGIVSRTDTGTLKVNPDGLVKFRELNPPCPQCNHLMVINAGSKNYLCLNCGAKK